MENIIEEANRCLNCKVKPCSKACPLGNDIPTFIKAVKENNLEEAFNVLTQTTVLGAICGRVCPHQKQCMGSCVRGIKSNPINIGELETYVFDNALEKELKINKTEELKGKKVAVIGGGPSGITCAAFLSMNGANVTIYEKQLKLGGITRYGIPDFRLPREVIDKTVEKILSLGVEAKCNQELGKDYELVDIEKQYDAVYLSVGANVSSKMNIPGEDLDGVYGGNELLETGIHPDYTGKSVAVSGGGNVAMDAARTAKRLGAKNVYIVYRRGEQEIPARAEEVHHAKEEGIIFKLLTNPVKIEGEDGWVKSMECVEMELGEPDESGRRRPVVIEGSNFVIETGTVIVAIGQSPNPLIRQTTPGLDTQRWGGIIVDEDTMKTSKEGVFAGGDVVTGAATVILAMGAGKTAAKAMDEYLSKL